MPNTILAADGGPITLQVFNADKNGNPIGTALDPSNYTVTVSADTGAATVAANVITPDPEEVADGETLTLGFALVEDAEITGTLGLTLTGEATQLIATATQAPASEPAASTPPTAAAS